MARLLLVIFVAIVLFAQPAFCVSSADPNIDEIGKKTISYFDNLFDKLKQAAQQDPNYDTYRKIMKPVADGVPGFYDGTLVDPNFVIRQVYSPAHFLARGYDLKKVKELGDFYRMMKTNPAPQLSEPGHGSIFQPRLIAMRYPVIKDNKLKNILSMMVHTEEYLKASGLDECKAYKIFCRGVLAEQKGKLSQNFKQVKLNLPSTNWLIQYDK